MVADAQVGQYFVSGSSDSAISDDDKLKFMDWSMSAIGESLATFS